MREETALKLIGNLRRYKIDEAGKSKWYNSGPYVPQKLIPQTRKSVAAKVDLAMRTRKNRKPPIKKRIRVVDPLLCTATQKSLRYESLRWNLRNWETMQRVRKCPKANAADTLPILVEWEGRYVIWNGHHRTTIALVLGRRLRAHVWTVR